MRAADIVRRKNYNQAKCSNIGFVAWSLNIPNAQLQKKQPNKNYENLDSRAK